MRLSQLSQKPYGPLHVGRGTHHLPSHGDERLYKFKLLGVVVLAGSQIAGSTQHVSHCLQGSGPQKEGAHMTTLQLQDSRGVADLGANTTWVAKRRLCCSSSHKAVSCAGCRV